MTAADGSAHVGLRSFVPMIPVWAAFLLVFIGLRAASSTREVESLRPLAVDASRRAGLQDVDLLLALVDQESKGNAGARSSAGALGLTQLKAAAAVDAAARLKEPAPTDTDLLDPATNLRLGASYLQLLIDRFGGDIDVALAAYFKGAGWVATIGGPPAVHRWLEKPSDVTLYVTRIRDLADRMRTRAGG